MYSHGTKCLKPLTLTAQIIGLSSRPWACVENISDGGILPLENQIVDKFIWKKIEIFVIQIWSDRKNIPNDWNKSNNTIIEL